MEALPSGVINTFASMDAAIENVSKSIKNGSATYSEYIGPEIDDNISRLEKLIVIRAALTQVFMVTDEETSEPSENFEAGTDPVNAVDEDADADMRGDSEQLP